MEHLDFVSVTKLIHNSIMKRCFYFYNISIFFNKNKLNNVFLNKNNNNVYICIVDENCKIIFFTFVFILLTQDRCLD